MLLIDRIPLNHSTYEQILVELLKIVKGTGEFIFVLKTLHSVGTKLSGHIRPLSLVSRFTCDRYARTGASVSKNNI